MSLDTRYTFQRQVATVFAEGNDLVLQAPTGAGKTRAASEPALLGFDHDRRHKSAEYPPRIFYITPMRTLTRDIYKKLQESVAKNKWKVEFHPHIQTGEQPDDPMFAHKLIIATVDQVLASFLNIPYGLPRRLDNINAGALIGSYFIFDEVHLYPRQEMFLTVLAMLKMLKGISRFTMMSATLSRPFLDAVARELGAEVITENEPPEPSRFDDIKSVQTQRRTWRVQEGRLSAEQVERLKGRRTICICNTVDRAQALYHRTLERLPNAEVILLHSRFYPSDRREIEDRLLQKDEHHSRCYFERSSNIILIATQVVEVGLDISADVLLTECAPAASLIQRAGRCARRENEGGEVHVFQPLDDDGTVNYAPYIEDDFEDVCHKTWEALTGSDFDRQDLRFAREQRLVDKAHSEADHAFLYGLGAKIDVRISEITKAIREHDPGSPSRLIRKADTVPLYVTPYDDPSHDEALINRPLSLESFSVSRGLLSRFYKTLQEMDADLPFFLAGSDGVSTQQGDDDGQSEDKYIWTKLHESGEVYRLRWFAAPSYAVAYHRNLGLRLVPSEDMSAPQREKPSKRGYHPVAYAAERYQEHIEGLWLAYSFAHPQGYTPLRDEAVYPLRRLCERYDFNEDLGERLLHLTLALHDVGKLNRPWQAWAGAWQGEIEKRGFFATRTAADIPLAHTDNDRSEPIRAIEKEFNKRHSPRGTHAVESAEACLPIIAAVTQKNKLWAAVVVSAIMHHHTPTADSCGAFQMIDNADAALRDVFTRYGFTEEADQWISLIRRSFRESSGTIKKFAFEDVMPFPSSWKATLMYFLFVRILRLADQRSGEYRARFGGLSADQ